MAETFHSDFIASGRLKPEDLATLSFAIWRMQSNERPFIVENFAREVLRSTRLPSALEQLDNLILHLGRALSEPGERHRIDAKEIRAKLGAKSKEAATWILDQALERRLIQGTHKKIPEMQGTFIPDATLSVEGWSRFADLQINVAGRKRAFMAMQYGDPELNGVFRDCFKQAAKRSGFDLVRLDDEPRAGLIDDRLRLDIRTARFLVADLSHANNGAYWEAGYAEGLGRPVIYTCKESVFKDSTLKQPHFDTNHSLTVLWNPQDLRSAEDQLATTIRLTLPSEAILSDD